MNNELVNTRKEKLLPNFRYYLVIILKELRKTMINLRKVGLRAQIWTPESQNTKEKSTTRPWCSIVTHISRIQQAILFDNNKHKFTILHVVRVYISYTIVNNIEKQVYGLFSNNITSYLQSAKVQLALFAVSLVDRKHLHINQIHRVVCCVRSSQTK
jgi:hypothetical protein